MRIVVVVLGDLGRSPRMLYHALALADGVGDVDLVGYVETELPASITKHRRIAVHRLRSSVMHVHPALFAIYGILRVVRQSLALLRLFFLRLERPDVLLVQNPPAVPTLLIALIAARLRSARLIVDWHNFGYTMLALRLGPDHFIVRLARWYERALGRRVDTHLCVSEAMAAELTEHWGIGCPVVFHDRPHERFSPVPAAARHDLLARLVRELGLPRLDRPLALVASPTGWTGDEDIEMLVDAAVQYDEVINREREAFPDLLVVMTGLGPLREDWMRRMNGLPLRRVHLRTLWFRPDDYAVFIGSADVGISLHRSSSGLDLPMKIADLLGAGVPVCALDYAPCLAETLRDGENGLLFSTSAELAQLLCTLFRGYPGDTPQLERLRGNVSRASGSRWQDEWTAIALPVFLMGAQ